jgi:hypothetical protein
MRRHLIASILAATIVSQGGVSVGSHGHTAGHHRSSVALTVVGAVAALAGGALIAHARFAEPQCDDGIGCVVTVPLDKGVEYGGGGALVIGGGIMLATSLLMGSGSDSPAGSSAPTPDGLDRELAEVRAEHAARIRVAASLDNPQIQARVLTIRARDWARRGRCDVVRDLGAKVAELDAGYHDSVFATDAELSACR